MNFPEIKNINRLTELTNQTTKNIDEIRTILKDEIEIMRSEGIKFKSIARFYGVSDATLNQFRYNTRDLKYNTIIDMAKGVSK